MTAITQQNLDTYKAQYPADPTIQALTLAEVQANTAGKTVSWPLVLANPPAHVVSRVAVFHLTPCEIAVGKVIVDVVLLAIGASELSGKMNAETVESVAAAAHEGLVEIEGLAAGLGEGTTTAQKAKAIFGILSKIYSIGCLGAVISAIFKSLSWWDMILYGIVAIAEIVALVLTDGGALAAEFVALAVSGVFMLEDVKACIETCSAPTPPTPTAGVSALRTYNGHYMTVAKGGGLDGGGAVALDTNRTVVGPWECFTVVPIDKVAGTFALKCVHGQYLTANGGGGMGGPDNSSSPCHTDATSIGDYEQIQFVPQSDGTIAIATYGKTWITAEGARGIKDPQFKHPFRSDANVIGPWETFTLVSA